MRWALNDQVSAQRIKDHVKKHGVRQVATVLVNALREGKLSTNQLSFRVLWEGFVGPLEKTLSGAMPIMATGFQEQRTVEAVTSQAFTYAAGNLIIAAMIEGYNYRPSSLDALVQKRSSSFKMEPLVGFQAHGTMKTVAEGQEYDEGTMAEKAVMAPEPEKRGRTISITDETLIYDRTGQILDRARDIGQGIWIDRESRGMYRIQDLTSYKCYYPIIAGTATQTDLYRTSAGTGGWYNQTVNAQTGNALEDWTDIDDVMQLMAAVKDENDNFISPPVDVCLIPTALWGTALRIFNAVELRATTNTNNVTLSNNIVNQLLGTSGVTLVKSDYMNDTSTWYIGAPKMQFVEREIIPPQLTQIPGDPRRDVVVGFKARYKSQVEAKDDKFFFRNAT